ncbi:MAG: DUF362 domain-containing protein [Planctomycetota bacterium]
MANESTRREFLERLGSAAMGAALGGTVAPGCAGNTQNGHTPAGSGQAREAGPDDAASGGSAPAVAKGPARVAIARDEALISGRASDHADLLRKMLDAALQRVTMAVDAPCAWRALFKKSDRVGIKVNTLGLTTQPAVAEAIVAGLLSAGVAPENILIWDRFDSELATAGFKLNRSMSGVRCRGTDAEQYGSGYCPEIESSGEIGSCFSKIVAEEVSALISVPVLKDHNLAGVSLGLKNFYGAIHNPNKYHTHNCDPYVADVVGHRFIRPKWRLTVCDGTRAQYHAGPARHPGFAWPFAGLIVSTDVVAADAVAADLLEQERCAKGLKSLAEEERPPKHIATAAARGFGVADLSKIECIEV